MFGFAGSDVLPSPMMSDAFVRCSVSLPANPPPMVKVTCGATVLCCSSQKLNCAPVGPVTFVICMVMNEPPSAA